MLYVGYMCGISALPLCYMCVLSVYTGGLSPMRVCVFVVLSSVCSRYVCSMCGVGVIYALSTRDMCVGCVYAMRLWHMSVVCMISLWVAFSRCIMCVRVCVI